MVQLLVPTARWVKNLKNAGRILILLAIVTIVLILLTQFFKGLGIPEMAQWLSLLTVIPASGFIITLILVLK